jgi:hypothetical protein
MQRGITRKMVAGISKISLTLAFLLPNIFYNQLYFSVVFYLISFLTSGVLVFTVNVVLLCVPENIEIEIM